MGYLQQKIETEIPALRRYAPVLVRDAVGAEDLVQECLTRALGKRDLWSEGTDLRAWLFTILHNQHANHVRRSIRRGPTIEFDEAVSTRRQWPIRTRALKCAISTERSANCRQNSAQ